MSARLTSMLERAFNIVRLGLLFQGEGTQGKGRERVIRLKHVDYVVIKSQNISRKKSAQRL